MRNGPLAYGLLSNSLTPEVTGSWIRPYQEQAGLRHDAAGLVRGIDAGRWYRSATGRRIAAAANKAPFIEIDGARTFVVLDRPAVVPRHIRSFVEQPAL